MLALFELPSWALHELQLEVLFILFLHELEFLDFLFLAIIITHYYY